MKPVKDRVKGKIWDQANRDVPYHHYFPYEKVYDIVNIWGIMQLTSFLHSTYTGKSNRTHS